MFGRYKPARREIHYAVDRRTDQCVACSCAFITVFTMWLGGIILFFVTCFVGMLPAGWAEIQQLSVKKNETKVLLTKPNLNLKGDSEILWKFKPRGSSTFERLASFSNGILDKSHTESFKGEVKLDEKSGALTLVLKDLGDSGIYHGQVTEVDNTVHEFEFNITVEESVPTPNASIAGHLRNTTKDPEDPKDGRTHYAVVPVMIVFLGIVLAIITKILATKKGTSETVSSSSASSSSVDLDSGKQLSS